jgi:hypothetical protein
LPAISSVSTVEAQVRFKTDTSTNVLASKTKALFISGVVVTCNIEYN